MITRKHLMIASCLYGLASLLVFAAADIKAGERFYDEQGRYQGRILENGRIYNSRGEYQGRIEGDRLYDEQGKYRGRVVGSSVLNDADQWTGATVRTDEFYRMHRGYFPEEYEED